jgi:hypothetical protein
LSLSVRPWEYSLPCQMARGRLGLVTSIAVSELTAVPAAQKVLPSAEKMPRIVRRLRAAVRRLAGIQVIRGPDV